MRWGVVEFVIEFFVGDVDVLGGSDAVDNQFRFNIIGSPLLLATAQRDPIDVYGSRVEAFRSQGADHAPQPHTPFSPQQRVRYRDNGNLIDGGHTLSPHEPFLSLTA